MRIAYFGTHDFSANILKGILGYDDIEVLLTVSQPDRPVGRKKELIPTPVKKVSLDMGIECLQPEKLRMRKSPPPPLPLAGEEAEEFHEKLKSLDLDFIVVVAYGKIIPQSILDIPKCGCINIHGSILPKYRGASPIQEAIKNGDTETGLTIMYMSKGMDEGDILKIEKIQVDKGDKTPDIFKKFEKIGPDLLLKTLRGVLSGDVQGVKQDDNLATYCGKIEKTDAEIDFENETAGQIFNKFRSYYPWPGFYTYYNGKKLSIEDCEIDYTDLSEDDELSVGEVVQVEHDNKKKIGIICQGGILILNQVKLEGKKSMDILSFVNGNNEFLEYKF